MTVNRLLNEFRLVVCDEFHTLRAKMRFILQLCVVFTMIFAASKLHAACDAEGACDLGDRQYHVKIPSQWDGTSPLPVLVHFHGWGRKGSGVMRNKRVWQAAEDNNMLLVALDGRNRSWGFWSSPSDDVDVTRAMLKDVRAQFPIDEDRIFASGFSYGGAMVWRIACEDPQLFDHYLPIAGTLWHQMEETCEEPVNLTHVHGLRDTVMDMPVAADDPAFAVSLWRRENQCGFAADATSDDGTYACQHFTSCSTGRSVDLCLHKRGHLIPKNWLSTVLPSLLEAVPVSEAIGQGSL